MSNKSGTSSQIISLPQGGGALKGIGEKFSPDLFTGTGNFTVPIALPPGRNGFQPELNLVYSTGHGNGPFGLGWGLSVPGVSRKTSKGVPRYRDGADDLKNHDTFVLSGAEDLVPVEDTPVMTRYQPRTEGLFARIVHHHDAENDYWEARSKDGLVSTYGTPGSRGKDGAVIADPGNRDKVFAWKLTETKDPFGNRIVYEYNRDTGQSEGHHWDQLYLERICYVDYTDGSGQEQFLVSVTFEYEELPDRYGEEVPATRRIYPFSDYRAGFEIRTRKRCTCIEIRTHAAEVCANINEGCLVRTYKLVYLDQRADLENLDILLPLNGVSLLSQVKVTGHDGDTSEALPPLEFGYTRFEPDRRDLLPLEGHLPARSLASPDLELADLFGNGLPDILELNGTARYWRNLGDGKFDLPRAMAYAPAGLTLADPGVQLVDADGDGRVDLLATVNGLCGYYPLQFGGLWDRRSFQRCRSAPSFNLEDPEVKLVDLTGDGVTDALRSGTRLECFFNDPREGWNNTQPVPRRALEEFPNVTFADPRVKWGDMSGDGLQDILLIYDGNVEYWPNLGYGEWARRIHMWDSPRFPHGYDPRRILVGDVDGDGLADMVYVDDTKVTLWINQCGNGWSDPIEIDGTPPVSDMDAVRLEDLLGTGIAGVLWSRDGGALARWGCFFHDFTGGLKPYLLNGMNNHMGAVTKVEYAPATRFYLKDAQRPDTRWRTSLPFPVQVVARVEVIDEISRGRLITEYSYHHGYWDGAEREFRGFGRVDQRDTEVFERYQEPGLHAEGTFDRVDRQMFSPPLETRTWFHLGPAGPEHGDWHEADLSHEYWPGDPQLLARSPETQALMEDGDVPRRVKRDAVRSLRGRILRSELYALDGTGRQDRPYTITESSHGVRPEPSPLSTPQNPCPIFFPYTLAQRTTQWERGDDPMTQFTFTENYDEYGQPRTQTQIACPRGWRAADDVPGEPYLATRSEIVYARPVDPKVYVLDRVASTTTYEIKNDGSQRLLDLKNTPRDSASLEIIGQVLNFYDGRAFAGCPFGHVGDYGAVVRTETLTLTQEILHQAYKSGDTVRRPPEMPPYLDTASSPVPWTAEYPQAFRHQLGRLPDKAGYVYHPGGDEHVAGYFARTARQRYDFQERTDGKVQGLVTSRRDPLGDDRNGRDTTVAYDAYGLLPIKVTDPVGLVTKAGYDYRALQPNMVIDPNENRTAYTFSPLGLLQSIAVMGKKDKEEGDTIEQPGSFFRYGFLAFENSLAKKRKPIYVHAFRREQHRWDLIGEENAKRAENGTPELTEEEIQAMFPTLPEAATRVPAFLEEARQFPARFIQSREYSDGFGRLVQTRTQAEGVRFGDPVFGQGVLPANQGDDTADRRDVVGQENTDAGCPNVVVSGWQVYDNKGRVVEKYEPFFDAGWEYARPTVAQRGQKTTLFYDPRGQVIRTVNPDGSEERVVYGVPGTIAIPDLADPGRFEPTPWEAHTYDANDNADRTHPQDPRGKGCEHHWDTPESIVTDALGRTIKATERNRSRQADGSWSVSMEEYHTTSTYDVRGNLLTVTDALGRQAFCYFYDLTPAGDDEDQGAQVLRTEQLDAGVRRVIFDAAGNEVERRDSKSALILQAYDALNRPSRLWARDDAASLPTLRERVIYGDSPDAGLAGGQAKAKNLLGKVYRHYDEAGLLTFEGYDFKGNLVEKVRQVVKAEQILAVFDQATANNWRIQAFRLDWQPPNGTDLGAHAGQLLGGTEYRLSTAYDALNRVKTVRYPEARDENGQKKRMLLRPRYNRAGALERVKLDGKPYVEHIAYSAKGQRILIAYGNGVMTRYAHDPHTFRLIRLRTERYEHPLPASHTYRPNGTLLQDFSYKYDLAGNILRLVDRTPGCGVRNNRDVARITDSELASLVTAGDALVRRFAYDALYRLVRATGRECKDIPSPRPWTDDPRSGFNSGNHGTPNQDNAPNLTVPYWEEYAYDPAGNMVTMKHGGNGAPWTRYFGMGRLTPGQWAQVWPNHLGTGVWANPPGNRLTHVGDNAPTTPETHLYDQNGNLVRETTSHHFEWDHSDRLRVFRNQTPEADTAPAEDRWAQPSIHAHYLYDADGQRVMKLVRRQGGQYDVRVYVDGLFEHYHWNQVGTDAEERQNARLYVMDDQQRIAIRRIGKPHPDDKGPEVQYHLSDHLGSSNVVVDRAGAWINREEYTPYGETSFGSFARKRCRFTGKERDEESGLYYHGARYYAPWLTRWISCDPIGLVDGKNLFLYVSNNPIKLVDPVGHSEKKTGDHSQKARDAANELWQMSRDIRREMEANPDFDPKDEKKGLILENKVRKKGKTPSGKEIKEGRECEHTSYDYNIPEINADVEQKWKNKKGTKITKQKKLQKEQSNKDKRTYIRIYADDTEPRIYEPKDDNKTTTKKENNRKLNQSPETQTRPPQLPPVPPPPEEILVWGLAIIGVAGSIVLAGATVHAAVRGEETPYETASDFWVDFLVTANEVGFEQAYDEYFLK
jgi:RHS repeat-associated protein